MKKGIIYRLSPLNNTAEMSAAEYIIKKLLAFSLIYLVSGIVGEAVIIGILYGMGYDPLQGVMPQGEISELLFYYGFIIYSLVALAYCRFIEKRKIKTVFPSKNAADYFAGGALAAILLTAVAGVGCISGAMKFSGVNTDVDIKSLLLWALAFAVQGGAEEIMCRGFLLNSLNKRISAPLAVFISSTAFIFPHLATLLESDFAYAAVGIVNLYLVSIIFSLFTLRRRSIWLACGLHSAWNFILYSIMGLSLSGSENTAKGIILFSIKDGNLLNGAEYGMEASVITTAVLGILLLVMVIKRKGRNEKSGVQ